MDNESPAIWVHSAQAIGAGPACAATPSDDAHCRSSPWWVVEGVTERIGTAPLTLMIGSF